ncbi:hypothetical protein [uncultured Bartonella sp.]|nr:hypothetical protein [uncultured Bartonella sp.]
MAFIIVKKPSNGNFAGWLLFIGVVSGVAKTGERATTGNEPV